MMEEIQGGQAPTPRMSSQTGDPGDREATKMNDARHRLDLLLLDPWNTITLLFPITQDTVVLLSLLHTTVPVVRIFLYLSSTSQIPRAGVNCAGSSGRSMGVDHGGGSAARKQAWIGCRNLDVGVLAAFFTLLTRYLVWLT